MKRVHSFFTFLFLFHRLAFGLDLAPNLANYEISVSLDENKKTLKGKEKLVWLNASEVAVSELQFHMYLNAFKDKNSTFMKESGGKLRADHFAGKNFGSIKITKISSSNGKNVKENLRFIQPDDENELDETVLSLKLDKAILPGESIELSIDFEAQLPKVFARTGFGEGNYFLVGQWFPKIGVFEKDRQGNWNWNCHQFHAHSEFYADFGEYQVEINVPSNFIVGATGEQVSQTKLKGNRTSYIFKAADVHDFAWTASPDFKVYKKMWKGVELRALMQPEHAAQNRRYFDAAEKSLIYFEKVMGKYPYSTLTLVDPPLHSSGSGGMEYPTFITCGSYWGIGKWLKMAEIVTVHEFGHQYFQGILASNEFEQSFLDEGFNQYMEGRIMDEMYGQGAQLNFFGFTIGDTEASRISYTSMDFPEIAAINNYAWKYPKGSYSELTYTKTATALRTFENLIGRPEMDKILRAYFEQFKFKHPRFSDFRAVVNEVSGKNYDWYFDQTFEKSFSCDYSVDTLVNTNKGDSYFLLKRKGALKIPQDIRVKFYDGSVQSFVWSTEELVKKYSFSKPISAVFLDPQRKNLMDLNLINNSYTEAENADLITKYSAKFLFWFQQFMFALVMFIA